MNNEERILALLEAMQGHQEKTEQLLEAMHTEQKQTSARLDTFEDAMIGVREDLTAVKQDVADTKDVVVRIENEHGQKLDALFDGYKQNADRLDRIQSEVTRHEEVILRRVK